MGLCHWLPELQQSVMPSLPHPEISKPVGSPAGQMIQPYGQNCGGTCGHSMARSVVQGQIPQIGLGWCMDPAHGVGPEPIRRFATRVWAHILTPEWIWPIDWPYCKIQFSSSCDRVKTSRLAAAVRGFIMLIMGIHPSCIQPAFSCGESSIQSWRAPAVAGKIL